MADFHFIRPYWLFAFIVLAAVLWLIKRMQIKQSGWSSVLPKHLSNVLLEHDKQYSAGLLKPFIIGALAIIALAGPSWNKLPQPVFQAKQGSIIVMDMSYSMYSTDLTPNRLVRARFKALDLIEQLADGDVGLIAYAGDAFVISPLTEDINNIKLLLPSLSPDLMPELGSNPLSALTLAHQLLSSAGFVKGDIYWITDGIDFEDVADLNDWNKEHQHRLHVLGVGTKEGAPIKLPNEQLLKDEQGAIVLPRLNDNYLQTVAIASGGNYQHIATSNKDIETLLAQRQELTEKKESEQQFTGDQWQEAGPYLILLLIPLILPYFRKGALALLLAVFITMPSDELAAQEWQDWFRTKDQQGQKHFEQQQFDKAAQAFENDMWQGSAHYRNKDYQKALDSFKKVDSAESLYNQGNAYAQLGDLEKALDAYDQALNKDPNFSDAKDNKKLIEDLQRQQQQQQDQGDNSQNDQQKNDQQQDNGEDQQGENGDGNQEQQQQSEQNSEQSQQGSEQQSDSNSQNSNDPQSPDQQDNSQQNSSEQNNSENSSSEQNGQSKQENAEKNEQDRQTKQEQQAQASSEQEQNSEEQPANAQALAQEQIDQEKAQKHQQLLKKVTDDPYLLLRNKMKLEYQKRRQAGTHSGAKKKW